MVKLGLVGVSQLEIIWWQERDIDGLQFPDSARGTFHWVGTVAPDPWAVEERAKWRLE